MKLPKDFPETESSRMIGRAVERLKKMSRAERIQLMVSAKLLSQEDADKAIASLPEAETAKQRHAVAAGS